MERFSVFGLLGMVFILCAFLMVVPRNALSTVSSPNFVTYMGSGRSDIRIDLQHAGDMEQRFTEVMTQLASDPDVAQYSGLITTTIPALNTEGVFENLKIEIGDFTLFPLVYLTGSAPSSENEIALSVLNAADFGKDIGDAMTVIVNETERTLTVSGIYQDVTNGGRTAKAMLPYDSENILWYTVNLNLVGTADNPGLVAEKIAEYRTVFYPASVVGMDEYVAQTLGGIVGQLELATILAAIFAIGVGALITAMFFKMLIAQDQQQISILRSIGFNLHDISIQYLTRALIVLTTSIITGTFAAALIGPRLTSLIIPGVSSVGIVVSPLIVYLIYPMLLIAVVIITLRLIGLAITKSNYTLTAA